MNADEKIEQRLRAAPKPPAPAGLVDRLQTDVSVTGINAQRSALRRWFASPDGRVSRWRVATAAAIALALVLPLSYGANKLKRVYRFTFETRQVLDDGMIFSRKADVTIAGDFANEEEARSVYAEIRELKKAGKYERTLKEIEINGVKRRISTYRYVLSNGRVIEINKYDRD